MAIHPDPGFLVLVTAHEDTLLRAARLLTGDWARAEDLLRETLIWALTEWRTLADEGAAPLRVRQRLVAMYLSADGATADEAVLEDAAEGAGSLDGLPRPVYARPPSSAGPMLVDTLGDLEPEDRAVLVSRYYLGLSAAEIGEVLGVDVWEVEGIAAQAVARVRRVR
jgi:DNA-directed RNA polymerase specialized sigma24 family protein